MKIKRLVLDAMFGAITIVLYCYAKFNLPMLFPSFLDINFSMLPILICLYMLGLQDALIVAVLRIVGKFLLVGTGTMYVGELADFLMSIIIVLGCFFTFKFTKNSIINFIAILLFWNLAGIITNVAVNIPLYIKLMGMTYESLADMCSVIPGINETNFMGKYLLYAVIPFNSLLAIVVGGFTMLVHRRLKVIYDKI